MYSSLELPFFTQSVVFGPRGFKEAAGDLLFYFYATVYEIYKDKSESESVGYLHSPCSFPSVYVDNYFVLCGRPVRVAIHSLAS